MPTPPDVPAVPASEAGLELVHGLSEPAVDVYVDRTLLVGGFAPGEIAGPLDLTEGSYTVELFSTIDDPAQDAQTRTDPPLIAQALPISGRPETVVVAKDAGDGVVLRSFADDVSPIAPGQGRFAIRNPSSRTILVTVDPVTDGAAALERQAVSPGGVLSRDLPSGDYQLFITEEDQSPLLATVLSNPEGELTSATFLRDGSPRLILQRIGDLGTPPNGIPTGTDGLLPGSGDPTAGLVIAALGALGLFVVIGRERLLDAGRN
ncbi:MAG: DUF4397 domain-containing protein [Acidimicrobiia bacterium]|nr:DUF4397 domain-containing protein [Acidimicrobiia bacterium]